MAQTFDTMLPAVVAGTPVTQVITEDPSFSGTDNNLARAMVTAPTTIASPGGTNYANINIRQLRAGSVVNTLATLPLANTALTAEVPVNIPLSASVNESTIQPGDVLDVNVTHTGTGQALAAGCVVAVELT